MSQWKEIKMENGELRAEKNKMSLKCQNRINKS